MVMRSSSSFKKFTHEGVIREDGKAFLEIETASLQLFRKREELQYITRRLNDGVCDLKNLLGLMV